MRKQDARNNRQNRVAGLLQNREEAPLPAGYYIAVNPDADTRRPIASGLSHADGGFVIPLDEPSLEALKKAGEVRLVVDSRFGMRVAEAGPFGIEEIAEGVLVPIDLPADRDRPDPVRFWNPFSALRRSYPKEISALQNADIRDWRTFEQLDVDALADQIGLQAERLHAFRLHAEMNTTSPIFDVAAATMLVRIGVRSRRDLASREPHELLRDVAQALKAGSIGSEGFQREYVGNWVYLARGWDLYEIYHVHDPAWIRRSDELIWSVLIPHNPSLDPLKFIEPSYWATLKTIAHMRAILTSAGVHDLSALAPFKIRGRTRIRPGYHFQPGSRQVALLDDAFLRELLVTQGGAFSKVTAVNVLDYGLHIVPNPVTQAVILGPLINFIDDGAQIIIGRDVTELIIVTETIDYDLVNKIVYEDDDLTPPQPAPFAGPPDLPRFPTNLTSAYTPGSTNRKGRDGLRGIDGMAGSPAAFLPGAKEETLLALTERVIRMGLRDWEAFAAHGTSLKLSVNTPVSALLKLPMATLLREERPRGANWPGLILEVTEDEILDDLKIANEVADSLRAFNCTLALDDFGAPVIPRFPACVSFHSAN
jgi:EAL domain